jgi:hypothetical protein
MVLASRGMRMVEVEEVESPCSVAADAAGVYRFRRTVDTLYWSRVRR